MPLSPRHAFINGLNSVLLGVMLGVAFVNNMVEVAPRDPKKNPVFSFVKILFGALSGPLLSPTFSS